MNLQLTYPDAVVEYCRSHYGYTDDEMRTRFNGRAEQTVNELLADLYDLDLKSMMDIGCGIGGTTAALATALMVNVVHLVESSERKPMIRHGFNQELEPWNDVHVSQQMVKANVPRHVAIFPHDNKALLSGYYTTLGKLDLITSFRSWCHHYPADVYLEMVRHLLKPWRGRLVVDVRTDTDGMDKLKAAGFRMLGFVSQRSASIKKTGRYVFRLEA